MSWVYRVVITQELGAGVKIDLFMCLKPGPKRQCLWNPGWLTWIETRATLGLLQPPLRTAPKSVGTGAGIRLRGWAWAAAWDVGVRRDTHSCSPGKGGLAQGHMAGLVAELSQGAGGSFYIPMLFHLLPPQEIDDNSSTPRGRNQGQPGQGTVYTGSWGLGTFWAPI